MTYIKNAYWQALNIVHAIKIVLAALAHWPLWMRVGDRVTILRWKAADRSWVGAELVIREVDFPFVYFEDTRMSSFRGFQRIEADLREVTFKKIGESK